MPKLAFHKPVKSEAKKLSVRVLIPTKFSRASGGLSAFVDLGKALHGMGFEVFYYSDRYVSLLWLWRVVLKNDSEKISYRQIVSLAGLSNKTRRRWPSNTVAPNSQWLAGESKRKSKTEVKFKLREFLKNLVEILWRPLEAFLGVLRRDQVKIRNASVIFVSGLDKEAIGQLRSISDARLFFNHFGSAETFINWFLQVDSGDRSNSLRIRDRYISSLKSFDLVLFESADQLADSKRITGIQEEKLFLLRPSCEEQAALRARAQTNPFGEKGNNIAVVGSLQERKGQHLAIEAMSIILEKAPSSQLHFIGGAGDGRYQEKLIEQAHALDIGSRVSFHGHRADYLRWIAHADLILQPSFSEGVSRILREAIFLRRRIVAFDIIGTREILSGRRENLAAPYHVDDLARKVIELLSDPHEAQKLADYHLSNYMANYSWSRYQLTLQMLIEDFSRR